MPKWGGKTTTLRCISTLIKPDSGDIFIGEDNISVVHEDDKARGKLSFLTSELKLEDHFTPNYLFNFFGNLYGLEEEEIEKIKRNYFRYLGLMSLGN